MSSLRYLASLAFATVAGLTLESLPGVSLYASLVVLLLCFGEIAAALRGKE